MPEKLANQIAAGEVVERPASVVKELVENALDAGATRVVVETKDGGRALIAVTDNGGGMSPEDAPVALKRHATSKIRTEEDLWRIATLGFRGEALPAIASVSRLTLTTRERGAIGGTLIRADGGDTREIVEAGAPEGTRLEIRDLFFNTPGRRKFLRAPKTELAHIAETLVRLALWRPGVYFELLDDGRSMLRAPATESIPERIGALLGREVLDHLFAFDETFPAFRLRGYATNPDYSRSAAHHIFPYINGRCVRDKVLLSAVGSAYSGQLIKGRYPAAAFNVEIDPALVDVNVHPTKAEVRFRAQSGVFEGVRRALTNALAARFTQPAGGFLTQFGRSTETLAPRAGSEPEASAAVAAGRPALDPPAAGQREMPMPSRPHTPTRVDIEIAAPPPELEIGRFAGLAIIGQLADTYILCENRRGAGSLLLIDQHAAHERVNYERLRHGLDAGAIEVQNLLFPITLELRPVEAKALASIADELARIGLVVAPFGPDAWRIESVPALIPDAEARDLALDAIEHARQAGGAGQTTTRLEAILMLAACHGSVRAGQALTLAQMREILRGLDECEQPTTCPHGRPTVREFPLDEIERMFARR
jgi:DNA mismatch repair protein MutL